MAFSDSLNSLIRLVTWPEITFDLFNGSPFLKYGFFLIVCVFIESLSLVYKTKFIYKFKNLTDKLTYNIDIKGQLYNCFTNWSLTGLRFRKVFKFIPPS